MRKAFQAKDLATSLDGCAKALHRLAVSYDSAYRSSLVIEAAALIEQTAVAFHRVGEKRVAAARPVADAPAAGAPTRSATDHPAPARPASALPAPALPAAGPDATAGRAADRAPTPQPTLTSAPPLASPAWHQRPAAAAGPTSFWSDKRAAAKRTAQG